MKDVILLPTYNERDNVKEIIPEIFSYVPDVNVLVVDDSSPDGTADVVRGMMVEYPSLDIMVRPGKAGLGAAYTDAMKRVRQDKKVRAVFTMDADGSHDPMYLPAIIKAIDDSDFVIGSRYTKGGGVENWEFWRKSLSRYGNMYPRFCLGIGVKDLTAGFSCVRREFLERLNFDAMSAAGYAFLMEYKFHLVRTLGARVIEVPIIFKCRREGETKFSRHIIIEGLKTPLRLLWRRIVGD